MTRLFPIFLICLFSLNACNWVGLTSDGQNVQIATASQVSDCRRLGRANTQVRDRVGLVNRGAEPVQEELTTLARNEAAEMGGNTIVAETVISDGRQTFGVYDCP